MSVYGCPGGRESDIFWCPGVELGKRREHLALASFLWSCRWGTYKPYLDLMRPKMSIVFAVLNYVYPQIYALAVFMRSIMPLLSASGSIMRLENVRKEMEKIVNNIVRRCGKQNNSHRKWRSKSSSCWNGIIRAVEDLWKHFDDHWMT